MGYREARRSNASDEGGESGGLTVRVPLARRTMTGSTLRRLQEVADGL
jgi:hypothetical protein